MKKGGERRERFALKREKREKEKKQMREKMGLNPFILLPNRPKVHGSNPTHSLQAQTRVPSFFFLLFSAYPIILLHPLFCIHSFLFLFFAIFYRIHLLSCIFIFFYHTLFYNISYWFSSVFFAFFIFILSILNLLKCKYRLNINHAYLSLLSFILFSRRP